MRPLRTIIGYAAMAAGIFLVASCSPTAPAPARPSPTTSPAAPGPTAAAPGHTGRAGQRSDSHTTKVTAVLATFTMPEPLSRPVVYSVDQGLLVVGGLDGNDRTTRKIWRIGLSRGVVRSAGRMAAPVHDAAGALVAGRDLLFGGGSIAVSNAVQDVTPGAPPRLLGHLPHPRADLVAISAGDAAYLLGGFDGASESTTILRTRDGRSFTALGILPVSVRYPAAAVIGGSIWLFGGEHAGRQVGDVQRIDLSTGRARVAGHLPHPLAHAGAFTLADAVFIAGGRIGGRQADTVMRFDPASVTFTTAGHLPAPRSDFGVAVVAGTAYLVGGENPKPVGRVIEIRLAGS